MSCIIHLFQHFSDGVFTQLRSHSLLLQQPFFKKRHFQCSFTFFIAFFKVIRNSWNKHHGLDAALIRAITVNAKCSLEECKRHRFTWKSRLMCTYLQKNISALSRCIIIIIFELINKLTSVISMLCNLP